MVHRPHRPHNFRALSKPKQLKKSEHRHYLPYLPVLLLVVGTFLLSLAQPIQRRGVLAYATNMSSSGLLAATNNQREQNGVTGLQLNSSLSAAAQAKANDMVTRNYWSHNTPDGQQPWVFVENAGYKFQKAGENLAYGFTTSADTVTGWMNSATHRENLLDAAYSEVGFGFANGESYNSSGPETVVVAMYGRPLLLGAASEAASPQVPVQKDVPVTTDNTLAAEPASREVARLASLTNGSAPAWAVFGLGLMTGLALVLILAKHAAALRHVVRDSERFVLHHPLLDTVLVSLVLIGSFLSQTTGFIR